MMMKNPHNMTQISFLVDYLRPVSDALSYEQYDHPERIVSLHWAKDNIDILSGRETLEKELSEYVSILDMGSTLQSLYVSLASVAQEPNEPMYGFKNGIYFYNETSLRSGYLAQRDEFEKMIIAQESIVDSLDAQIEALESRLSRDDSFIPRFNNRRARLDIEREKLNELYARQCKLNEYLNILNTCYKPALDHIAAQCRILLPIVEQSYKAWMVANPPTEKPCRAISSWDYDYSDSQSQTNDEPQHDYFSPGLIIRIYELCNGKQFEDCNSTRFIDAINLRATDSVLKIKDREKVRVCHLINQLWGQLPKDIREEWLSKMLTSLGISRKFYNSKYSISPREYDRSKVSNTFCKELSEIFSSAI